MNFFSSGCFSKELIFVFQSRGQIDMNDPAEYIMGNMIILNKNQMIIHGHLAMSMALVLLIYSNSLCFGAYVKFKLFLCYLY